MTKKPAAKEKRKTFAKLAEQFGDPPTSVLAAAWPGLFEQVKAENERLRDLSRCAAASLKHLKSDNKRLRDLLDLAKVAAAAKEKKQPRAVWRGWGLVSEDGCTLFVYRRKAVAQRLENLEVGYKCKLVSLVATEVKPMTGTVTVIPECGCPAEEHEQPPRPGGAEQEAMQAAMVEAVTAQAAARRAPRVGDWTTAGPGSERSEDDC